MAQYEGRKTNQLTDIEEISLYQFDQYRKTGDNNWLRTDYTGKGKKIESAALKTLENEVNDRYYRETDDRSFQLTIQTFAKIDALATKYSMVLGLIDTMSRGFAHDRQSQEIRMKFVRLMQGWGYHMNELATPLQDYERLQEINNELPGIKTQINILREKIKQKEIKVSHSLQKQVRIVQIALGLKADYSPKLVTLWQWIEDVRLMEEISKQN